MLNLFAIALLALSLWNIRIFTGREVWNSDYLSPKNAQAVKGLLAMVVLLHHLAQSTTRCGEGNFLFHLFAHAGLLPVAVFFFYSGYGLQKRYMQDESYRHHYLQKRIPTLLFPYLIATALYWLLYTILGDPYSWREVLRGFYNGHPIVKYSWYVLAVLAFYFVFYLLMVVCKKHYIAMVLGAGAFCLLWRGLCRYAEIGAYWYSYIHILVLGMLWAVGEKRILEGIEGHHCLWIALASLGFLAAAAISHFGRYSFNELVVVLFVVLFVLVLTKVKISNGILRFLGRISYEIYLFQGLFIVGLRNGAVYIENGFLFCLLALTGTLVVACLAHLCFRWVLARYSQRLNGHSRMPVG